MNIAKLPRGIVPLLETPFLEDGGVDYDSLQKLVEHSIAGGTNGLTGPLVASEVHALSIAEREQIVKISAEAIDGRVPFIVGASSDDPQICRSFARLAERVEAAAYLVAVPNNLYGRTEDLITFFRSIVVESGAPLIVQDLQFNGPGMGLDTMKQLRDTLPTLVGLKIETVPAGAKYTMVREAFGPDFYISGGWAVPQLIEALDRGVDAMIPECAPIRVYSAIYRAYASGERQEAIRIFRELVPVLVFSNQELYHSIAFFKRMLARRKLIRTEKLRAPGYNWDRFNLRIADELTEYYLALEQRCASVAPTPTR
ncbi:MAG TPA: dihydrodipicolinate synthase family protein [Candidatus Sulfotelmatobacter sp.]|nr:dihydrodipicolinate synthase family protein [Candidatus Sulfotelmatobacter sp.]